MNSSNNLIFFPIPYDDELMYSILARYHYYTPKQCFTKKQEQLFGRVVRPSLKFASFLKPLCERMEMAFEPEDFIKDHTIIPYYSHLVPRKNREAVYNSLIGPSGRLMVLLSRTRLNYLDRDFRYCPLCAAEDLKNYGETFFHVSAHLDGIDVCPRHHVYLRSYSYDRSISLRHKYLMVDPHKLDFNGAVRAEGPEVKLSELAVELLELPTDRYDGVEVRQGILKTLRMNNLMTENVLKRTDVYEIITESFRDVLVKNNLVIKSLSSYNWLISYLQRGLLSHPLVPLLLVGSFYDNFNDFIKEGIEGEVVAERLPCHNPFCSNYKKQTATLVSTDSDYKGGTYRCSCGQIYHVYYDRKEDYHILDYGKLYVDSVLSLMEQGGSYNKVAKEIGITRQGLKKQVTRFSSGYLSVDERSEKYLKEVRDYKKSHSESGGMNLTSRFNKQYSWIRKYKPECVPEFYTVEKYKRTGANVKDYSEQDAVYLKQVVKVVEELFERKPPVWVSKRLIIDNLEPVPSRNLLSKLDRTTEFINSHYESRSEFYLRSVLWESKELLKANPDFDLNPKNLSIELKRSYRALKENWEEIVTKL